MWKGHHQTTTGERCNLRLPAACMQGRFGSIQWGKPSLHHLSSLGKPRAEPTMLPHTATFGSILIRHLAPWNWFPTQPLELHLIQLANSSHRSIKLPSACDPPATIKEMAGGSLQAHNFSTPCRAFDLLRQPSCSDTVSTPLLSSSSFFLFFWSWRGVVKKSASWALCSMTRASRN
jgi:hypothetical protein